MPTQNSVSGNNVHSNIDFCENQLLEVVKFIGFLRASRSLNDIPEDIEYLYNHELSKEDNIEIAREAVYDLRRKLDSLKRSARVY